MDEQTVDRNCAGMNVVVRDAHGDYLQKRAVSNVEPGYTFAVVFVAWRDEPQDAEGVAWPWEDVYTVEGAPDGGLSHDEYKLKCSIAQKTPTGTEIPVPTRSEFMDNLRKAIE